MLRLRGFTLIELMVTVALLAVILGLAVPSFRTALQNNRITAQANDFLTAFQLGRSEALKRNAPVVVCASSNGQSCGGPWVDGWIVAEDRANAGDSTLAQDLQVLRVWPGPQGGTTLSPSDAPRVFRFLPRGAMDGEMGLSYPVTLEMSIPDCRGDQVRNILINRSGRVTVERAACSS